MQCPFCKELGQDKVIDSRATEGGSVIRRRRRCLACNRRYTTYERVEETGKLTVVKRDGRRVPYDRQKIYDGILRACWKRPVAHEQIEAVVGEVEEDIFRRFEREVASAYIGNAVALRLRKVDQIAYLRFASTHHRFNVDQLIEEARDIIERERTDAPGQQDLFDG